MGEKFVRPNELEIEFSVRHTDEGTIMVCCTVCNRVVEVNNEMEKLLWIRTHRADHFGIKR